jgi:CRP-like cAMP-binding protein
MESAMSQISTSFIADPELFQLLKERAQTIAVGPDRVLFRQGDPPAGVYLLKSGDARLSSISDSGDEIFNVKVGAGSLLGLPAVIGMKPYSLTAEVLDGAELSMLTCEDFVVLMQSEPTMPFRLLQVLAAEVRFARETLAHL